MNKLRSSVAHKYLLYAPLCISISLMGWQMFDKAQQEQVRAQRQATIDAINRDREQLCLKTDEHYKKGQALINKRSANWTKAEMSFAEGFTKESKQLKAKEAAIERRCREYNASIKNG